MRNDAAAPYRGRDRRGIINARQEATGRPFFIAGFGLVTVAALVLVMEVAQSTGGDEQTLAASFELSAGAMGVVAATLGVVRWRLAGDARALWLGTAVGAYAALAIALSQLLPAVVDGDAPWIRPAGLIVSLLAFAWVLRSPEVNARLRPAHTFGLALTGFAIVGLLLVVLGLVIDRTSLAVPTGVTAERGGATLIALAWAGFATAYVLRGMRDQRLLFAWYGLTMFGLTLAELIRTIDPAAELVLGSSMIRCIALLYAVIGVTRELQTMFASQSSRLLQTTVDTLSTSASLRAAQQHQQEMAHEARNALTAIEGATQTLERFRENLDDETRQSLAVAVSSEIGRLQRLVGASAGTNHPVSFRLADIIGPQLELARAQGAQVLAATPGDLVAYGQPADFAEVLQNLLINARIHGRGPITVRATDDVGHILVSVEDRGPGVPEHLRRAIFERGRRASDAPGSGLGLYVSRELMKGQRGNLWVEEAAGGGAAFVMAVPSGPTAATSSFTDSGRLEPVERGREGGKPANGHRPLAVDGAEHADVRARARRRKHEDPVD
jgi:signal transduction histidine kinase